MTRLPVVMIMIIFLNKVTSYSLFLRRIKTPSFHNETEVEQRLVSLLEGARRDYRYLGERLIDIPALISSMS